jgi:hypothetical protein
MGNMPPGMNAQQPGQSGSFGITGGMTTGGSSFGQQSPQQQQPPNN